MLKGENCFIGQKGDHSDYPSITFMMDVNLIKPFLNQVLLPFSHTEWRLWLISWIKFFNTDVLTRTSVKISVLIRRCTIDAFTNIYSTKNGHIFQEKDKNKQKFANFVLK